MMTSMHGKRDPGPERYYLSFVRSVMVRFSSIPGPEIYYL